MPNWMYMRTFVVSIVRRANELDFRGKVAVKLCHIWSDYKVLLVRQDQNPTVLDTKVHPRRPYVRRNGYARIFMISLLTSLLKAVI